MIRVQEHTHVTGRTKGVHLALDTAGVHRLSVEIRVRAHQERLVVGGVVRDLRSVAEVHHHQRLIAGGVGVDTVDGAVEIRLRRGELAGVERRARQRVRTRAIRRRHRSADHQRAGDDEDAEEDAETLDRMVRIELELLGEGQCLVLDPHVACLSS